MLKSLLVITIMLLGTGVAASAQPVPILFDTDIGNDVDDALALAVIHALVSRGECELLAVTITKDEEMSAPFVDAVNTFYGRGDIPIGVVRNGPKRWKSKYSVLAAEKDEGEFRYPHDLLTGKEAPEATGLLRRILAGQRDVSVVFVQVGASTNLARLLDSKPDAHSPLDGVSLVAKKVRVLSIMAGAFVPYRGEEHDEANITTDIPASQKLAQEWPTPMIYSPFEVGLAIPYPAVSIEQDFEYVEHHPIKEAYRLYQPPPHERPTWDLTSVLWAVRPNRGYFDLSKPGRVIVTSDGYTRFEEMEGGPHRYLLVDDAQKARTREALTLLTSQPPDAHGGR